MDFFFFFFLLRLVRTKFLFVAVFFFAYFSALLRTATERFAFQDTVSTARVFCSFSFPCLGGTWRCLKSIDDRQ